MPAMTSTTDEQRFANTTAVSINCRPQTRGLDDDDPVHRVMCVRNDNAHTPPSGSQLNRCITRDHDPATHRRPTTCMTTQYMESL